jgi:4-hydroxy-3-polyprenylbenzoate decarboxylase
MKHKVIVAITGASGSIYAKVLLARLQVLNDQVEEVGVVMSDNAKQVWEFEMGDSDYKKIPFRFFGKSDFNAPFASGSARFNTMIICPCSMGTMARIATGISNDLITRAADVILKERRKLILVTRDTPLSLIHINNMKTVTEAGGIICPASPSFYSHPKNFDDLASTVVDRVLDLAGFQLSTFRWNEKDS